MVERTAEQTKAENIKAMGRELGEVYSDLWQQTVLLNVRWFEYLELFGTKPSRIELLNRAAPQFFRLVQDALFETVVLQIARMVDPAQTMGKDNLSIQSIKKLDDDAEIRKLVDAAVECVANAREWRHKVLAHRDKDIALREGPTELAGVSRKDIQAMISAIVAVLNALCAKYLKSETVFDLGVGPGGATSVLYTLDDGLRAKEEVRQRLERGEPHEGDFAARDL